MYGLEKKKQPLKFNFDLEVEIEKKPKRAEEILEKAHKNSLEIKASLKKGGKTKDLDNLGIVLQGYTALEKVINKIGKL